MPEPPENLAGLQITVVELKGPFFRTHGFKRSPFSVGNPAGNRFDAPDGSYEVLYVARDQFCAFIETFMHVPGTRTLTTSALRTKALSTLTSPRHLRLIDLAEPGALVRAGVDARLFSAEYASSQLWSKAFHDHPAKVDGLLYPSRLDPSRQAVALFLDRIPRLVELDRQIWYAPGPQRALLVEIAEHYKIELIENEFVASRKPAIREDALF